MNGTLRENHVRSCFSHNLAARDCSARRWECLELGERDHNKFWSVERLAEVIS